MNLSKKITGCSVISIVCYVNKSRSQKKLKTIAPRTELFNDPKTYFYPFIKFINDINSLLFFYYSETNFKIPVSNS